MVDTAGKILAAGMAFAASIASASPDRLLVTQYIAPAGNPTWENRVTNTAYAAAEGFVYERNGIMGDSAENYILNIGGTYYMAFESWLSLWAYSVKARGPETWTRSLSTNCTSAARYLYAMSSENIQVKTYDTPWAAVDATGNLVVMLDIVASDIESRFNSAANAVYAQCVHTDYVYHVTYSANGGGGAMPAETFTNSHSVAENGFSYPGYDFNGWNTRADGAGTGYAPGQTVGDTVELFAQWKPHYYMVETSVLPAGCGFISGRKPSYGYGEMCNLTVTPQSGYHVVKWQTADAGEELSVSNRCLFAVTGDVSVVVQLGINQITVKFDGNGGTGTVAGKTVYAVYDEKVEMPESDLVLAGNSFSGWCANADGSSTRYNPRDMVRVQGEDGAVVTFYAIWAPESYTVSFNRNGGSGGAETATVTYGELLSYAISTPHRDGYAFSGYFDADGTCYFDPSGAACRAWDKTGGAELTAYWTPNSYFVAFAAAAETATGSMECQAFTYDVPQALCSNMFRRTGYSFSGWASRNGGGAEYADGETVSNLTTVAGATNVLYAVWAANEYEVAFDVNMDGATVDPQAMTVTFGSSYGTLPVPTPADDGYAFTGWFTGAGTGDAVTAETIVAAPSNHVLYAHWQAVPFQLEFAANGGRMSENGRESIVTNLYMEGAPYGWLPVPTNAVNARFAGWWTSTNLAEAVQHVPSTVADMSVRRLYARWKPVVTADTFTVVFDAGAGSVAEQTRICDAGAGIGELPSAARDGFRLFGWALPDGTRIDADYVVEGDITLSALWTLGPFADLQVSSTAEYANPWTVDAATGNAKSGAILDAEGVTRVTRLSVKAYAAGSLSFDWRVSCEDSDSVFVSAGLKYPRVANLVSGDRAGHVEAMSVSAAETLVWEYSRTEESSGDIREDAAWVSNFVWVASRAATPVDGWAAIDAVTSVVENASFAVGGSGAWALSGNAEEVVAAGVPDGRSGWVRMTVPGPGVLSFDWRVACEQGYVDTNGEYCVCDRLEFFADGVSAGFIDGPAGGFARNVHTNLSAGAHVYEWRYVKDGSGAVGEDSAWLRNLVWTPASAAAESEIVEYTDLSGAARSVEVPHSWVDAYDLLSVAGVSTYLEALLSPSGKKGFGGSDLMFWQDYVAATDPTNANDVFRITGISVDGGTVSLEWSPDHSAAEPLREYTVYGKTNLADEVWHTPVNPSSRFFRVEVRVPEP